MQAIPTNSVCHAWVILVDSVDGKETAYKCSEVLDLRPEISRTVRTMAF